MPAATEPSVARALALREIVLEEEEEKMAEAIDGWRKNRKTIGG